MADLVVRPGTDLATSERIAAMLYGLNAWASLGGELAARGPHRLAIAARAARAAASGGVGVSADEEAQIAQWFTRIVEEAMTADRTARLSEIGAVLASRMPSVLDAAIALLESVPPAVDAARPARYELQHPIGAGRDPSCARPGYSSFARRYSLGSVKTTPRSP